MKFDWDRGNTTKCSDRVPLAEIEAMIAAGDTMISGDPHADEKRFRAIGKNKEGRSIFVVFTIREINGESRVRPISARYEHRKKCK